LPRSGPVQPTYNDKLSLYSFFKQAVKGDVKSVSTRPGVFDVLGRAKYDAWKQREGIKPTEAKRLYVETVLKVCDLSTLKVKLI
ncbi:acyl-CoA-binding protein, partial [Phakopsora pachyrhizi]